MAFDEVMADRVRDIFEPIGRPREMKMFGGLAFMYLGHMCVGLWRDGLIFRIGPQDVAEAIGEGRAQVFEPMRGKPAGGMAFVPDSAELDDDVLEAWIVQAVAFCRTLPPKPMDE